MYSSAVNSAPECFANLGEHNVDGDEMNGIFLKEMDAVKRFMAIHPMQTMYDTNRPGIGNMVSLPAPEQIKLQNWLLGG